MYKIELVCHIEELSKWHDQGKAPVNAIEARPRYPLHRDQPLRGKVGQYLVCAWMGDPGAPCQVAAAPANVMRKREQSAEQPYMAGGGKDVVQRLIKAHW